MGGRRSGHPRSRIWKSGRRRVHLRLRKPLAGLSGRGPRMRRKQAFSPNFSRHLSVLKAANMHNQQHFTEQGGTCIMNMHCVHLAMRRLRSCSFCTSRSEYPAWDPVGWKCFRLRKCNDFMMQGSGFSIMFNIRCPRPTWPQCEHVGLFLCRYIQTE